MDYVDYRPERLQPTQRDDSVSLWPQDWERFWRGVDRERTALAGRGGLDVASQCKGQSGWSPRQAWGRACRYVCLITALHLIHNSHGGREIRAAALVSTQKEQIWAAMQIARKVPSFEKKKEKKGWGGPFALKEQFTQKKKSSAG